MRDTDEKLSYEAIAQLEDNDRDKQQEIKKSLIELYIAYIKNYRIYTTVRGYVIDFGVEENGVSSHTKSHIPHLTLKFILSYTQVKLYIKRILETPHTEQLILKNVSIDDDLKKILVDGLQHSNTLKRIGFWFNDLTCAKTLFNLSEILETLRESPSLNDLSLHQCSPFKSYETLEASIQVLNTLAKVVESNKTLKTLVYNGRKFVPHFRRPRCQHGHLCNATGNHNGKIEYYETFMKLHHALQKNTSLRNIDIDEPLNYYNIENLVAKSLADAIRKSTWRVLKLRFQIGHIKVIKEVAHAIAVDTHLKKLEVHFTIMYKEYFNILVKEFVNALENNFNLLDFIIENHAWYHNYIQKNQWDYKHDPVLSEKDETRVNQYLMRNTQLSEFIEAVNKHEKDVDALREQAVAFIDKYGTSVELYLYINTQIPSYLADEFSNRLKKASQSPLTRAVQFFNLQPNDKYEQQQGIEMDNLTERFHQ